MGSSRPFGAGYSKGAIRGFAVCFIVLAVLAFALGWHKVFGTWPHLPSR